MSMRQADKPICNICHEHYGLYHHACLGESCKEVVYLCIPCDRRLGLTYLLCDKCVRDKIIDNIWQ